MTCPHPPALRFHILRKWGPLDIQFEGSDIRAGGSLDRIPIQWSIVSSIVGASDEDSASDKFVTYALVSVLLVPEALKKFRDVLKHERLLAKQERRRKRKLRKHEKFIAKEERRWKRLLRTIQREKEYEENLERRLGDLLYELRGSSVRTISETDPPFRPPHWVGEERPNKALQRVERKVEAVTKFPDAEYLRYLVSRLSYEGTAAIAATVRAHTPWRRAPADRRRAGTANFDENDYYLDNQSGKLTKESSQIYQVRPYSPEAPSRRTTQGGFPRKKVLEVLRRRRWDSRHVGAVYEVMCQGQSATEVAERIGLELGTLYSYCYRVTKDLRDSQE